MEQVRRKSRAENGRLDELDPGKCRQIIGPSGAVISRFDT